MKATIGALVAIVAGLVASLALANDYLFSPAFCASTGCDAVRASSWSHPLGIPMPVIGAAYFVAMFVLLMIDRPRLRRGFAVAGALGAVGLIAVQGLVIGAWCKLCLIVDPAVILLAVCVLAGAELRRFRLGAVFATATTVAVAFAGFAMATESTAPAPAPAAYVAPKGDKVTIVEMLDFECPYCRAMNKRIEAAIAQTTTPVEIVRKMVPLTMHKNAMPAALAWCCADAQGKGNEMASALFAAEPSTLTTEGCASIAAQLGCDMTRYEADMAAAHERVAKDLREATAIDALRLPTVFIGNERITGLTRSTEELVAAIERARG
jgi:protein-disulfide isomerase